MSNMFADDRPRRGGRPWARVRDISVAERLADEGLLPDESRGLLPKDSGHLIPDNQAPQLLTVSEFATLLVNVDAAKRGLSSSSDGRPRTNRVDCNEKDLADVFKAQLLRRGLGEIEDKQLGSFERVLFGLRCTANEDGHRTPTMKRAIVAACTLDSEIAGDSSKLAAVFRENRDAVRQMQAGIAQLVPTESTIERLPSGRDIAVIKAIAYNMCGEAGIIQHGSQVPASRQEPAPAGRLPQAQVQMS